jgi:hypothetical protein
LDQLKGLNQKQKSQKNQNDSKLQMVSQQNPHSQTHRIQMKKEAEEKQNLEINLNQILSPHTSEKKPALTVQSDEDDVNLDPTAMNCEQLMSCMEQNLVHDKSKLNSREEQAIYDQLLDLSSPDPKSQSAIDKMPKEKRNNLLDGRNRFDSRGIKVLIFGSLQTVF